MSQNGTESAASGQNGAPPAADDKTNSVEALEALVKEKEAKYLYLYADFENFKKRVQKERTDLIKFGWESVARELLQVADNLDLAVAHMPPTTDKNLADGLKMIGGSFRAALQRQGVETVESLNKPFDPNLHDAVAYEQSGAPAGTVTQEHTKGYTLHGRLLRPARVVVSSGPVVATGAGETPQA